MAKTDWKAVREGYNDAFGVIRTAPTAVVGYRSLVDALSQRMATDLWPAIRQIDIAGDVTAMRAFLRRELASPKAAPLTGLYFGLDTLNMEEGRGKNMEIGGSPDAARDDLSTDWCYRCSWYGSEYLVQGLYRMYQLYHPRKDYGLSQFLEMPLWVGYTGLVLAEAFDVPGDPVLTGKAGHRAVVWGHHDGDLFVLGHAGAKGFHRVAKG